jgi:hypothetical protein
MEDAIFLSAGVPDPRLGPEYAASADPVAIASAVSALVYVVLGRRALVWGGQPAITPMVWVVAQDLDVDYSAWVRLYQSDFFEDDFPEENKKFANVVFTKSMGERETSILEIRRRMFTEHQFSAAVFIGGMKGIIDEFNLFRELQPEARVIPILSTGGAALDLMMRADAPDDLFTERDYVALLHRHLEIDVREERFKSPVDQPKNMSDRYWRKPSA